MEPGYTRRFSLSRLNSGKLSSLKPLSQNWEDCFVRAIGYISHSDTPIQTGMRIIRPTQTQDLWRKEWRGRGEGRGGGEFHENVQIILYLGEVEPVGDARL